MHFISSIGFGLLALGSFSALPCRAQCFEWDDRFFLPGANNLVQASTVFDDGSGPALFIGGRFGAVGNRAANLVAKWDGESWSPLGSGVGNYYSGVYALAVYDDGGGPALYAGGDFTNTGGQTANRIAKWNGAAWSSLGTGMDSGFGFHPVYALAVFDDGGGPALYAGGQFSTAGGTAVNNIAKWNGTSWSALGSGTNGAVHALHVFDDGSGPSLYAGGTFTIAGGASASRIAKWNGTSWSALGSGIVGVRVSALADYDGGSGPALFAGGEFTMAGGNAAANIARWNGTTWTSVGTGTGNKVGTLCVHDDGSGAALFVGGEFAIAGGGAAQSIAKWDGASWSALDVGADASVNTLAEFDDGSGAKLYVGGMFESAGGLPARRVATWDGSSWNALNEGPAQGTPDTARALLSFDDGSGPALYLGGNFAAAGSVDVNGIARWDGAGWSALGDGIANYSAGMLALAAFDDGSGPALFAGGDFTTAGGVSANYLAKWNGATWTSLGSGVGGAVFALAAHDDGSGTALYAAGNFGTAGGASAGRIARWNGTSWSNLGTGMNGLPYALAEFDDGSGLALYVGGQFSIAGGVSVKNVAKWNGTSWSSLGTGADDRIIALAAFDDGSGPALYAAGAFRSAGGVIADRIARWNGSTWSAVGGGFDGWGESLAVFDDGSGPALYPGGSFLLAGATAVNSIARWNGSNWSALADGVGMSPVRALAATHGVIGTALYAAGGNTGFAIKSGIERWGTCAPGEAYCFGDGLDPTVTAQCPCGNLGASGHGCANTFSASGGLLSASGTTTPNTIVLSVSRIPNNTLAVGFRNTDNAIGGGVQFGDGVRCQSGTLIRFGAHNSGTAGDSANAWSSATTSVATSLTRYYQVQYRNSAPAFCPPESFNITNGYRITW